MSDWALFVGAPDFMPRNHCGPGWSAWLILVEIISDLIIAIAYFGIPSVLLWFISKRRCGLPYKIIPATFAAFIFLCGCTHVFGVLVFWWPAYRFDAVVKAATAIMSIVTFGIVWRVAPDAVDRLALFVVRKSRGQAYLRDLTERWEAFEIAAG